MAAAENKRARLRNHGFNEDDQLASADQTFVIGRVLAQAEREMARFLGFDDLAGGVPHLGFHAPAADGAHEGTVLAHQDFGALEARNGPVYLNDGRHGALLAEVAQAHDFIVKVHFKLIISWLW